MDRFKQSIGTFFMIGAYCQHKPTDGHNMQSAKSIIRKALHTKSAAIDKNYVKRRDAFFSAILSKESTRKAFIQLVV